VGIAMIIAQAVSGAVQSGVGAVVNRWQGLQQAGVGWDVAGSRLAVTTGTGSARMAGQLSNRPPFLGTAPDVGGALVTLASQGAVFGGRGLAGQSGAAGARSIGTLQALMPGLNAQEAAGAVGSYQTNIAQQRMATFLYGTAARSTTAGGAQKDINQYFSGIFKAIQNNRQGRRRGQPYTREEWSAMRAPGSALNIQLTQMLGWNAEQINDFFTWAEAQSATDPSGTRMFTGTDQQMRAVRGGEGSLATEVQRTETRQGQADLNAYSRNAGAMMTQQEANRKMIDLQENIDNWLGKIYGVLSHVPGQAQGGLGGVLSNAMTLNPLGVISGITGMIFGGDVGDIGDNGLSQLNPDLRKRVNAMMAANPNLQVNSGYRNANEQRRLYEGGHPNMAPPGKSRHGRGQAVDLGPRSQMGWLNANARKFGLDTAGSMGEPWHVQLSGTMIGDAQSESSRIEQFNTQVASARAASLQAAARALTSGSTGLGGGSGGSSSTAPAPAAGGSGPTSGVVPVDTILKALYTAGFRGEDLISMGAIPARETHYKTDSHNLNPATRDDSYGPWQINARDDANGPLIREVLGSNDYTQLYDPYKSAQVAFAMYQRNNNTLYPWGPYKGMSATNGVPQEAIDAARQAAQSLWPSGYGDAGYGGGGGGYASVNSPVSIVNHFPISVNANGGNVDVNMLTRQIAAKLEPQVRRMQQTRR
jgi:hypothetical protein